MELREVFARNVREARRIKGLSQEELADAAGINRTYLSDIETSRNNASIKVIERLASALQVEPGTLLFNKIDKRP